MHLVIFFKLSYSLIELFDCVVVQQTVGERAERVAVIRLSLSKPLGYQVIQVGADK